MLAPFATLRILANVFVPLSGVLVAIGNYKEVCEKENGISFNRIAVVRDDYYQDFVSCNRLLLLRNCTWRIITW